MTKKLLFEHSYNLQQNQSTQSVEQLLNTAMQLHQRGSIQQAEQAYREVLRQKPKYAYAMNLLGVLLSQKNEPGEGLKLLQKAIKIEPDNADFHINLGRNFQEQGKLEQAEKAFAKASRLNPDSDDAWFNLGCLSLVLKKAGQAHASFRKTIEKNRNYLPAYNNLGNLYREMGMVDEALEMFNKVIELNPDISKNWYNLGMLYKDMSDGENSVLCFEKVTSLEPSNIKARVHLAGCRGLLLNDLEGAFREIDAVIETNPDCAPAWIQKAFILLSHGKHEEAGKFYRKAIEVDENSTTGYGGLVSSNLYDEHDINKMLALLEKKDINSRQQSDLHFSLGTVFDKSRQYEKAFKHFQLGNRLHRDTYEYRVEDFEKQISQLISMFDDSYLANHARHGMESELPVFIVGMPRSGTTLVEQILASHPEVHGAGELPYMTNIFRRLWVLSHGKHALLTENTSASDIPAKEIQAQAQWYLQQLTKKYQGVSRITDKATLNFQHIGFITLLFPQARIVHCQRNPMDTCLSIFMLKFLQHQPFAYDLQDLGAYYRQYHRLMSHWQSLPGDRIINVQYEDLIGALEVNSRKLVDHIGLPWNEKCLRFYETERNVHTASHLQVRQKIYTSSRERWRHYEPWLDELQSALADIVI